MRATTGAPPVPGSAALSGGDEHHVRASECLLDLLGVILGGTTADFRVGASAGSAGEGSRPTSSFTSASLISRAWASVLIWRTRRLAGELDHAVDGVDTATADAHYLDHREVVSGLTSLPASAACSGSFTGQTFNLYLKIKYYSVCFSSVESRSARRTAP